MGDTTRTAYVRDDDGTYQADNDAVAFLLMDREQARLDKDFKTADALREQIEELGVVINDKARTWAAGPKPEEKDIDYNSHSVNAALTLHPMLYISGFGEEVSEEGMNEVSQLPTAVLYPAGSRPCAASLPASRRIPNPVGWLRRAAHPGRLPQCQVPDVARKAGG